MGTGKVSAPGLARGVWEGMVEEGGVVMPGACESVFVSLGVQFRVGSIGMIRSKRGDIV